MRLLEQLKHRENLLMEFHNSVESDQFAIYSHIQYQFITIA